LVIYIGVGLLSSFFLDSFKAEQLESLQKQIARLSDQKKKLELSVSKVKEYDLMKKNLDEDELMIRTKLDTIRKLIGDRSEPPKVLLGLATPLPADAWLNEVKITSQEIALKGSSNGYNAISDYMKGLGELNFFGEVSLKGSQQGQKDDVTQFELTMKRR
jgi:Tfp pilus assembly protein PilN